jgi:simple sugar transport system ATP-binding protein
LIKLLSGEFQPDNGMLLVDGVETTFKSPRDALAAGIATVYQDLALVPTMPVARNFFLGNEPKKGIGPLKLFYDAARAQRLAKEELDRVGVHIADTRRPTQVLSGGQRQCLAIARAAYLGARVVILDEPTSALGVNQASIVLRYVARARDEGLGIIFITHNINHAYPIGDSFTFLNRGESPGTFTRDDLSKDEMVRLMAGGVDLVELDQDLRGHDARVGADSSGARES